MDGSGNQGNLRSRLAVGVARLQQGLSSRLRRDKTWTAPPPAHPPFLTREQGIESFKLKFKEGQLWRGQVSPVPSLKENPAGLGELEEWWWLPPLWLLPRVRKHLEPWFC